MGEDESELRNATAPSVANPAATGSAGSAFETKVSAACLTLLLTRGAPLCLGPGTLRTVHLQAGHLGLGWSTDDLLLEAVSPAGEPIKAALQVKRTFVLSSCSAERKVYRHSTGEGRPNGGRAMAPVAFRISIPPEACSA